MECGRTKEEQSQNEQVLETKSIEMLTSKPIVNSTQVQCNPETVSHLLRVALSCFGHCCHQGCALILGLLVLLVRLLRRTFLGHFVLVDHLRSFGLLSFGRAAVFTVGFFTTIMFIASFCFIFISIPFSIFLSSSSSGSLAASSSVSSSAPSFSSSCDSLSSSPSSSPSSSEETPSVARNSSVSADPGLRASNSSATWTCSSLFGSCCDFFKASASAVSEPFAFDF